MQNGCITGKRLGTWLALALAVAAWWAGPFAAAATTELDAGREMVELLSLADWMGPLAPVALSPFFGLLCLSAGSMLIERGLLPDHPLLAGNAVLQNETVLAALLILTLVTSLPRLTKVTKPLAQLADFLETYAGVVFMLVVQAAARAEAGDAAADGIVMAGLVETSSWVFMAIVTALNIVVIQTVRLFFEMLVWLSPIPLLDAAFEALNKVTCLALAAVYLFHPGAALAVNLMLFALCALFARSAYRRLRGFRQTVLLPLWRRIRTSRPS